MRDIRQRIDEANLRYKTGDRAGARSLIGKLIERADVTPDNLRRIVSLWQQYDHDPISMQSAADVPQFRFAGARRAVIRFYLDAGMSPKALALLGTAGSTEDLALRARASAMQGHTETAAQQVAAIIVGGDQTQCDALLARAWSNRLAHLARKSVIDAQQVVNECPQEPGGYVELAQDFQALGDQMGEFRTFDNALAAMPLDAILARSYYDRAIASGDGERAVSVARRVTRFAPSLVEGWALLGAACHRTKDAACADDAANGMKRAATAFKLDPLPGEPPSRELFSRLDR